MHDAVLHALRGPSLGLFALFLSAMTLTGCGHIEPWVKPYERAALAGAGSWSWRKADRRSRTSLGFIPS